MHWSDILAVVVLAGMGIYAWVTRPKNIDPTKIRHHPDRW